MTEETRSRDSHDGAADDAARTNAKLDYELKQLELSLFRWVRIAAVVGTVLIVYLLLTVMRTLIAAIFPAVLDVIFGAVIALVLGPWVDRMERRLHLNRSFAILLALGIILLCGGAVIYLVSAPIVAEAHNLAQELPRLLGRLEGAFNSVRRQLLGPKNSFGSISFSGTRFAPDIEGILVTGITSTVATIVDVIVVLVIAFWLLRDGEELRAGLVRMLPARFRADVNFSLDATSTVVGSFIRAQLLLALLLGIVGGAGCALLGVPFPLVVGLAVAVFELIPLAGPFLGGAVAVLLALTVTPFLAVKVVILFLAMHVLEGYFLSPRLQARFVRIHPLLAFVALIVGIDLDGFVGALFAVPVVSLLAVFVRVAIGDWKESSPGTFASKGVDTDLERRRRKLLNEFRILQRRALPKGAKRPR